MSRRRFLSRILPIVLLLAPALLVAEDRIEFDASSDTLLLELRFKGGGAAPRAALEALIAGESYQRPPAMQIFGDGRVLIHRYLADELRELLLSPHELRQVMRRLLAGGIHELSADQLRSAKTALSRKRYQETGMIRMATDLPSYRLDFQIDGYAPEGEEVRPVTVHESWTTVSVWVPDDALDDATLRRFVTVEKHLTDLYRRVEKTGTLLPKVEEP